MSEFVCSSCGETPVAKDKSGHWECGCINNSKHWDHPILIPSKETAELLSPVTTNPTEDEFYEKIEADIQGDPSYFHKSVLVKRKNTKSVANAVLYHDDPPCEERLVDGYCQICKFVPDMQSTCIRYHCTTCDIPLSDMKCPSCGRAFEKP